MSAEDRDDTDPLESLIAEIMEAEAGGETVDREALIDQHPEHADSLRDFFAVHDRLKSAAEIHPPTSPPTYDPSDRVSMPPRGGIPRRRPFHCICQRIIPRSGQLKRDQRRAFPGLVISSATSAIMNCWRKSPAAGWALSSKQDRSI